MYLVDIHSFIVVESLNIGMTNYIEALFQHLTKPLKMYVELVCQIALQWMNWSI